MFITSSSATSEFVPLSPAIPYNRYITVPSRPATMVVKSVKTSDLYARDPTLKKSDVEIIEEWLKKQPHLPKLEEYQILAFLHSCYSKIEFTKVTIDKYFTMKTHHPRIFGSLDEDMLKAAFRTLFCGILPSRTPEGYTVLLVKLLDPDPDVYNFVTLVSVTSMILTLYLHQNGFATGGVVVFESEGFSFTHITKTRLGVLKCSLDHVQEGAPVRIKGIHFINVVPAMEKFKMVVKPFLKTELYNMIKFHSSHETLYKEVPQKIFPKEYGGEGPSIQVLQEENLRNMLKNYEFFRWHDSQRVDESKRIVDGQEPVFGVNGTFKRIEID